MPFFIEGTAYGLIEANLAKRLLVELDIFIATESGIGLSLRFDTFESRSEALLQATQWMCVHYGKKLRKELYPVALAWGDKPIAQIDRVAVPWLGVRAWGIHVNGFVRKENGLHLWIGERAMDRLAEPGKLDNMIGGGQPIGLSLADNLCKEAKEEAGLEPRLALQARAVRTLNYRCEWAEGIRTDTLFLYDLELPQDFTPQNTDGEVAAFHLLPLKEVASLVYETNRFKFNCNMVIIDFLMRHSFLTSQDAEYAELTNWLSER